MRLSVALKFRVAELEAEVERLKAAGAELARVKAQLEKARQDIGRVMEERDLAREELQAARQSPPERSAPEPVEKMAARAGLPPLLECARLRLKAARLPCGDYPQCRKPTPCARLDDSEALNPEDKVCPVCKQVFRPNLPWRKYCSGRCQNNQRRQYAP